MRTRVLKLPPAVDPARAVDPPDVQLLLGDLRRLPAQRPALLRVVQLADDPDCSARQLADAAAMDPAFTARLLQLANAAFYGRPGRVSAIGPAVGVLGAETVRGLAVSMALGLAGEHGALPEGFWDRATATAAATRLVAPGAGADAGDAFCVGLLREVGQALLFRAAPAAYGRMLAECDEHVLPVAERAWCGVTNGEVAAAALLAAGLPATIGVAIARQSVEAAGADDDPLARALRAGVALARAVAAGEVEDGVVAAVEAALGRAYGVVAVRELALRAAAQAAALGASMR